MTTVNEHIENLKSAAHALQETESRRSASQRLARQGVAKLKKRTAEIEELRVERDFLINEVDELQIECQGLREQLSVSRRMHAKSIDEVQYLRAALASVRSQLEGTQRDAKDWMRTAAATAQR